MSAAQPVANQVFPANGSSAVRGQPELSRSEMRDALNEMPHFVEALAPAPRPEPEPGMEEKLENVPSYAGPGMRN